jgi:hypothetical protein
MVILLLRSSLAIIGSRILELDALERLLVIVRVTSWRVALGRFRFILKRQLRTWDRRSLMEITETVTAVVMVLSRWGWGQELLLHLELWSFVALRSMLDQLNGFAARVIDRSGEGDCHRLYLLRPFT